MVKDNNPKNPPKNSLPLVVTVVCLCYNHQQYVQEAISSVLNQDYKNIEIIVVDDASTDDSVGEIEKAIEDHPKINFIKLEKNCGNCRAFNIGLSRAKGDFIIDLAADDVLFPERISCGVEALVAAGPEYGVNFTDAVLIDKDSNIIGYHYKRDKNEILINSIPQGEIYQEILSRYFICPPTMMAKREVYDQLTGYDENLAYEDFDFLVRSSRHYKYCYTDKILVKKRILAGSLSSEQYKPESRQLISTFKVCQKAFELNKTWEEHRALQKRIRFEMKQAMLSNNYQVAVNFFKLYKKFKPNIWYKTLVSIVIYLKPNLSWVINIRNKLN